MPLIQQLIPFCRQHCHAVIIAVTGVYFFVNLNLPLFFFLFPAGGKSDLNTKLQKMQYLSIKILNLYMTIKFQSLMSRIDLHIVLQIYLRLSVTLICSITFSACLHD